MQQLRSDVPDRRLQAAVSDWFEAMYACLASSCRLCKAAADRDRGNEDLLARPCSAPLVTGCACPGGTEEEVGAAEGLGVLHGSEVWEGTAVDLAQC